MNKEKLGSEPMYPTKKRQIVRYTQPNINFPTSYFEPRPIEEDVEYHGGSKRFYAACAAMQGLISHYGVAFEEQHIQKSYYYADELLKQENG